MPRIAYLVIQIYIKHDHGRYNNGITAISINHFYCHVEAIELSPILYNRSPTASLAVPSSNIIMQHTLLLLAALSSLAASASIAPRENLDWPAPVLDYFSVVGRRVAAVKDSPNTPSPPVCNLAAATPPVAPTPLPSPSAGLAVYHVAIGRGTQVSILTSTL